MSVWLVLVILVGVLIAWVGFNIWRVRRAATSISQERFAKMAHKSQVIDVRDADSFRRKHILGARNMPYEQLKMTPSAIRSDQPVLLYDADGSSKSGAAAIALKKAGYKDLYILEGGLNGWKGKVKGRA